MMTATCLWIPVILLGSLALSVSSSQFPSHHPSRSFIPIVREQPPKAKSSMNKEKIKRDRDFTSVSRPIINLLGWILTLPYSVN